MKSNRKQKSDKLTADQIRDLEKTCDELVGEGLVEKGSHGELCITPLGRRTCQIMDELEDEAIIRFTGEAGRPVTTEEIEALLDEKEDALLARAITAARDSQASEHT